MMMKQEGVKDIDRDINGWKETEIGVEREILRDRDWGRERERLRDRDWGREGEIEIELLI